MASAWGARTVGGVAGYPETYDVNLSVDRTSGVLTNPVPNPTGTVIGLDLLAAAARSTGNINAAMYHVSNTVACHMTFGNSSVGATSADILLMPGERLMVLPNEYVSVIKAAGSSDGIIRLTECA